MITWADRQVLNTWSDASIFVAAAVALSTLTQHRNGNTACLRRLP